MNVRNKAGKFIVLSALIYLAVLGVTGELHLSSKAFAFFATLWLVQATASLWHARRHPQNVSSIGTTATDDIPPAG
jgi:hypothetical protein